VTAPAERGAAVRSGQVAWRALRTPGLSVKVLRHDPDTGASTTLIRLEAGARVPAHDHPAGEELFVLEGDFRVGAERLGPGDYLYTPPDVKHAASSESGCLVLVTLPKPIRVLDA
jgi:quercetin dioxygenase-like cupin family protein